MAQSYFTSSYTLKAKDPTKPFKLGVLAETFISLYTSDIDKEIVLTDDEMPKTYESLFEHLTESLNLNTENCFKFSDLLSQLESKLNKETLGEFDAELSSKKIDSFDEVYLEDLLHICFHEDNSNFGSFFMETGFWCSKPRHGEFGGYSLYADSKGMIRTSSSSLANIEPNTVCNYIQTIVSNLVHGTNNTASRKQVATSIYEVIRSYL